MILALIVIAAGIYVFNFRVGNQNIAEADTQASAVLPAVKAPSAVHADATVVPIRSAALSVSASGIVADVAVKEGERVEAGQVLIRLADARQRVGLVQAEAQLMRAEAFLQQLKAGARSQEIEAARAAVDAARAQLSKAQVSGPSLELILAETDLRRAEAQLDMLLAGERPENITAAEADVAAAKAAVELARVALAETELRAPFAGVVASIHPNVGEFISPGTPAVWLADDSAWLIETGDLTELSVVRVMEGHRATVSFDALPDASLSGRVIRIKPMGENRLGDITYKIVIAPDRHDDRLKWNMTATVRIDTDAIRSE